jgi:glutamine---fructose-6-phosphate transaminase (isomerizing)
MCGIFGGVVGAASKLRRRAALQSSIQRLFLLSESRGKEAAGLAVASQDQLAVYKAALPARSMIRSADYRALVRDTAGAQRSRGVAFIGHSRLVTDGVREVNRNNQPVITRGIVGIHNGIVVNHAALWRKHAHLERQYEVDSEVIFALLNDQLERGLPLMEAARRTYAELEGAASIAALFTDRDVLLLGTNNGSLYYRATPAAFIFGSERYIVDRFCERYEAEFGSSETNHLRPNQAALVELGTQEVQRFTLGATDAESPRQVANVAVRPTPRRLVDRAAPDAAPPVPPRSAAGVDFSHLEQQFPYVSMRDRLRRCTRCVLPETMPFVDFDASGVCAYCRAFQPIVGRGREALEALVAPHRRSDGRPDCIVGVSGGRDSIFGLHYLKTVLGMNPVAYTYDWGMVTDLARRNTSRICGKLGIEHILVSADIPQKREYIRSNVEAWLARPSLGTIPLFMAGDKAYFYYLSQVRKQLGVDLAFLCENLLERTDFKTGFAGVPPVIHDRDHVYTLPGRSKLALAEFYGREFATNRRYLNRSLLDTAKAFAYYYLIKRDFHNLYGYIEWSEPVVAETLLGEYAFERAEDTESLWRIGDGTAAFYNYIYHAMAGMTENDTFRSNQIRNNALTRGAALDLVERDNRPRFRSIQWYLATIGLDRSLEEVLSIIERAPKRYGQAPA